MKKEMGIKKEKIAVVQRQIVFLIQFNSPNNSTLLMSQLHKSYNCFIGPQILKGKKSMIKCRNTEGLI